MSTAFTEEQARAYMHKLLATMSQAGGSDLFIANDFPPSMKSQGAMKPMTNQKLTAEVTRMLAHSLMNETPARRVRQGDGVQLRHLDPRASRAFASTSSCSSAASAW